MFSNVKIVSGGTHATTNVLVDGAMVRGVSRIEILPMQAGEDLIVKAMIEVLGPDVDMVAQLVHHEVVTVKVDANQAKEAVANVLIEMAQTVGDEDSDFARKLVQLAERQRDSAV